MPKHLVIVESPTKAKTISRFLGNDYNIVSSYGHVRDLPKSKLGVAVDDDFTPQYIIPTRAKKNVTALTKAGQTADIIYFATDEDREGEAIAWHLVEVMKPEPQKIKRIVFHEITKEAIMAALQNPRLIDLHLVDAQQARRVLDRLVGYELSPFLWKKVARGLSAGRVQSVAVRLIVERERAIHAFTAQEYWTIEGEFSKDKLHFAATLSRWDNKTLNKFDIGNKQQAQDIVTALTTKDWQVGLLNRKPTKRSPLPPFTTSTLQQEANHRLGFSVKQTMMLAQRLYEGRDIGAAGSVGLITYMRTDSVNLANKFIDEARNLIQQNFGADYLTPQPRRYATKSKMAQEAHEAIRPTVAAREPDQLRPYLDPKEYKLYNLIWQRAMASQLPDAQIESTSLEATSGDSQATFKATGQRLVFDGWLRLVPEKMEEKILPSLTVGDALKLTTATPAEHFTEPPARYSEATLVKALEEYGIGRPSTYAPTISTIIDRGYVEKFERRLKPTDLALLVNDLLVEHFPEIVDYQFTANLENQLDAIAEGKQAWKPVIESFYLPFKGHLNSKEQEVTRADVMKERELGPDPKTGLMVKVRIGRYGPYIQLGNGEGDKKPKFASIPRGTNMDELTLAQAQELLALPRQLGAGDDGQEISAGLGRFGPYIKRGSEYRSLKDPDNVLAIDLARAQEIFATQAPPSGTIAELGDDKDGNKIKVKAGRFGAYVTNGTINATIPKDTDPKEVKLEEALEMIAQKIANPHGRRGRKKKE